MRTDFNCIDLNQIIDVSVDVTPNVTLRRNFDCALILGISQVITETDRVKEFKSLAEIQEAGFSVTSQEYLAASLYFSQKTSPSRVFIGLRKEEEDTLSALIDCRLASSEWYIAILTNDIISALNIDDLKEIASYVESASPETLVGITLRDQLTALTNIEALKAEKYTRTFVMFDNNVDNENKTAVSAIVGYMMGYTKKLNTSFTAAYKSLVGIKVSDVGETKLNTILSNNGNIYISQGFYYDLFRQGKTCSGGYLDEIIYTDMLINDIRVSVMSKLTSIPKIPQTEDGLNMLRDAMINVLESYKKIGFIVPGIWNGPELIELKVGDTLANGFLIQFDSLSSQSASDRASRIAPNCYIAVKLAGAIEFLKISLSINR